MERGIGEVRTNSNKLLERTRFVPDLVNKGGGKEAPDSSPM